MEEAEPQEEEDELPMYQEHYNALFSMDFVETKYPHDDTMRALGIFEDVDSMRYHKYDELDRAELDQGWGWIKFLAKGERKMITFRQLEILFGFTYGKEPIGISRKMSSKVCGLQSLKKGSLLQGRPLGQSMKEKSSSLTWGLSPSSHASDGRKLRGDRVHAGNLMPLLDSYSPTRPQPIALNFNKE
ncbi:unnamed protein product [Microthlaspi erraticum]|uniref:Arabidopsis retrotransposon Orf1 C-terminal domain-containing protein n=1 Tax=Microthlaspi erraticum TaxID=1685480 RepID=A0A6D2JQW0_9BRAS|nr:unnamed protein product [Microthlaspi erraticum]